MSHKDNRDEFYAVYEENVETKPESSDTNIGVLPEFNIEEHEASDIVANKVASNVGKCLIGLDCD